MNSKKQLSALLLFALTCAGTQLNAYEVYSHSNYSLGNAVGNVIDDTLEIPGAILDDTVDIVQEPTYEYDDAQSYDNYSAEEDNVLDYNYNNYGYTDEDNIDSDYDMELE